MTASRQHLAILGGGCAGLSLARILSQSPVPGLTVTVIEPRTHYTADRTWAFWETFGHGFERHVHHRWPQWRVTTERGTRTLKAPATPYAMLPAEAFYTTCREAIDRGPVDLRLGEWAGEPVPADGGGWWIPLGVGGSLHADLVVDTRSEGHDRPAPLTQAFVGWDVETQAASFDPTTAVVMDFCDEVAGVPCFLYVLPWSPHHALVEATLFTPTPVADEALEAVLRRHLPRQPVILRREAGRLPMGLSLPSAPEDPSLARAGRGAGALRPATGYAFLRIQRWAQACAQTLHRQGTVIGHPADPPLARWMDRVFLEALARQPDLAPDIALRVMAALGPAGTVRFFDDRARVSDRLRLMAGLPPWPFLRAAARSTLSPSAPARGCHP